MNNSAVHHPNHYNMYPVEVIDITRYMNFCLGNTVKYVLRAQFKGKPQEDLDKALVYLDWERGTFGYTDRVSKFCVQNLDKLIKHFKDNKVGDTKEATINGILYNFCVAVQTYVVDCNPTYINRIYNAIIALKEQL